MGSVARVKLLLDTHISRQLALTHQDPADRFIAATARVLGLTLVTADECLLQSTELDVLVSSPAPVASVVKRTRRTRR